MPDDPNLGILDRSIFRAEIVESFSSQIELLDQLVNYGTNLIPRTFNSSERKIPDIVVTIAFLKHAVSNLDGISILSREGAALCCFPHIRSLFEIDLYLRWIFQEDYEKRGLAYFVWDIRRKRYWLRCYLEGTAEYQANSGHMEGSPGENFEIPHTQEAIQDSIDHQTRRLESSELSEVNNMFDVCMSSSGKDVEWYKPFGPTSIRDMAIRLGDEGMYKVFYAQYSQATHGLSLEHQLHFNAPAGEVVFDHIRTLRSIDQIYRMTFNYAVKIYRTVLERYRPGEMDAFKRKYINEWRQPFWEIPKVSKDGNRFSVGPPERRI